MSKSALVFGASGVSGWSFVNEMLHDYPKKGTWAKVHALTNRPLKQEDSLWPSDPRLNIVSGIDLLKGTQEELEQELKAKVKEINQVTHVYYLAYKASVDMAAELADAVSMFQRSTTALSTLSPALTFVVLQTGGKLYGFHLFASHPTDYIHPPHAESQPRLKGVAGDMLFYHRQIDWITAYAADKPWSWCETRPDLIIGFVPNQNFYSLATSLGVFLALFREVNGDGATCAYPGSRTAWVAKSNDSSSDMIARQTLWLSLDKETEKGGGYNVADEREPRSWSTKWPAICGYFGLKGVEPLEDEKERVEVRTYIKAHIDTWREMEKKHGLRTGIADSEMTIKGFEYYLLTHFDFDRQYDMTKMYATGFTEERSTTQTWGGVFDRMRAAKMLP